MLFLIQVLMKQVPKCELDAFLDFKVWSELKPAIL